MFEKAFIEAVVSDAEAARQESKGGQRRVFTFGFGHACSCGRALANCYTVIEAPNARAKMASIWGTKWAFEYADEERAGVERYGYSLIESTSPDTGRCACGATLELPRRVIDLSVVVDDGKYEFQAVQGDYRIHVLRHGEPWLQIEEGHKAILSLMYALAEALERERNRP